VKTANNDQEIKSHFKARNGYSQNSYQGASSDLPGQHTTSGFLPPTVLPAHRGDDPQDKLEFRGQKAEPAHRSMRSRTALNEGGTVPSANVRRANRGQGH
jgi:hypothetical protein